ncbi:hypothetical protein [Ensifer sp. ENS09]|uniref:hypothetical protein n=1 Tax=Ensifer sp. ENS09 TaxID=2769263 RepID=UPI00352ED112
MDDATIIAIDLAKRVFHASGARADGGVAFTNSLTRDQLLAFPSAQKNDTADAEAIAEAASQPTMRLVSVKTEDQRTSMKASGCIMPENVLNRPKFLDQRRAEFSGLSQGSGLATLPGFISDDRYLVADRTMGPKQSVIRQPLAPIL